MKHSTFTDVDAARLLRAAFQLARAMEHDAAWTWSRASELVRGSVGSTVLEALNEQARARGGACSRRWNRIERFESDEMGAGHYVRVVSDVSFASGLFMEEAVVLRHDEDGAWRLAGYAIR